MANRYDSITIKAEVTPNGWIVDKPVITRSGIFTYRGPKGKVVREYRPDEEVFKPESLATLRAMPITDNHNGMLRADSLPDGVVVGSVLSPGEKQDSNVVADIVIHNVKRIGTKRDLSLGYNCRIDETPGEHNGEKYDQVQRDITYNHLAVVQRGRAGNARIRLDADDLTSFPTEEEDMPDVTLGRIRLDSGLEYQASPEVIVHVTTLNDKIKDLQVRLDKAEGERDAAKTALDTANTKHAEALVAERSTAKDRLALEAKATQHSVKFDGLSDREVKEAIIAKIGTKMEFKDRSDDYVNSAYDLTLAQDEDRTKKVGNQKTTTERKDSKPAGGSVSSNDARARMLARLRGEKEAA